MLALYHVLWLMFLFILLLLTAATTVVVTSHVTAAYMNGNNKTNIRLPLDDNHKVKSCTVSSQLTAFN